MTTRTAPLWTALLLFLTVPDWTRADSIPAVQPTLRDVVYGEAGGQKQKLDVYYPNMKKPETPFPAIICVHGGAWRAGSKTDMLPVAMVLTKADFVCVSVGYRLFDEKKQPDNVWPAQIDDVQRAVRWVRAHAEEYGIDPARIGAIGASAGGHLVALLGMIDTRDNSDAALAKYSSRVQCVADVFGPSDLTVDYSKMKFDAKHSVQDLIEDFIGRGRKPEVATKYKRDASPLYQVDAKTAPFLIYHGVKDPIVTVDNARKLTEALKKAKIPVEYIEHADEGHTISPQHIGDFTEKATAFFRKNLAGKSAGAPATK